ncbi:hypothetical protein TraAM80_04443 [Trypanosoma rangeli]|uniref:Uncharacterized protein n=1 Tax=Trypanosoma rangeli TaxID=5698 RepID=A0A422NJ83_TRYRA|nr:uncharacterized protein TraAM80_04443 [Trypanosoma rangeli]RNF05521.1 hypothetical protein TraAM80_04443 [Trypanosoma rangeli]|eukprot:RNF05521.1 hypothetical protein TraAM80_04443 [Trypanosoma rangeli]
MSWVRTPLYTAPQITGPASSMAAAQLKGYTCVLQPRTSYNLQACSATCGKDAWLSDIGKVVNGAFYAINGLVETRSAFDTLDGQLGSCATVLDCVAPSLQPFCQGASDAAHNLLQIT